ncbi:ATP-dependent Clp protease adapter ClpS, partial [Acinetobacter baumannii]
MRTNKRQTNLKDIKASFQQSGYVD